MGGGADKVSVWWIVLGGRRRVGRSLKYVEEFVEVGDIWRQPVTMGKWLVASL